MKYSGTIPAWLVLAGMLSACSHTPAFESTVTASGPFTTGADIRLTYNSDQDYWPRWTQDGQGILYAFVAGGATVNHRCLGLLPAGGGSRIWELCDNRFGQADSSTSFTGYALGSDGRLLYAESVANVLGVSTSSLWLADSANPFVRSRLLSLPVTTSAGPLNWLADISWTGPTTFTALGQLFETAPHCLRCPAQDSVFYEHGAVLSGVISNGSATVQVIDGTAGATSYSAADNGASIVFTVGADARLFKVPAAGGTPAVVAAVAPGNDVALGVSCNATICLVATAPIVLFNGGGPIFPALRAGGEQALRSVQLSSGATQLVKTAAQVISSPLISPTTGDVVAQIGGVWGHLQTFSGSTSDLHLYPALVH